MFSISCFPLTSLLFVAVVTAGYQVTSNTKISDFPIQTYNPSSQTSFFRIFNGTKVEIECPYGDIFDRRLNHCVKKFPSKGENDINGKCMRLKLPQGLHLNPDRCTTYYNCGEKCCYRMPCPDGLLFNTNKHECDYPTDAGCCEYVEKNPDKLVQ